MSENYKFFQNNKCEYFPCHKGIPEEDFNCLFCYCPLYTLGKNCGGNCEFLENGVKSCMNCGFPHQLFALWAQHMSLHPIVFFDCQI